MSMNSWTPIIDRWCGDVLVTFGKAYSGYTGELRYHASADNWETYEELEDFVSEDSDEAMEAFNRMVNKYDAPKKVS